MPQTINNMNVVWNDSGQTFSAIKMGVTDTASAAGSLLMDLQVGGSSKFKVAKDGNLTTAGATVNFGTGGGYAVVQAGGLQYFQMYNSFFSVTRPLALSSDNDTILTRRAAANLRLGAADAAGSAIAISSVASNQLTLASAHGLTTGAAIIITGSNAPSGTALNRLYYARVIAAAVIELYSTYDQATAASGTTGRISVTTAGTSASVRLATPFQSFGVQDFTGTDIPGQPFIIRGSRGTGTGPGGDIVFQVAPAGATGSNQNALVTALQISGTSGNTSTWATLQTNLDISVNGTVSLTLLNNRATFVSDVRITGGNLALGRANTVYTLLLSTASNRLELYNAGATDAPLVTFGGTDNTFPAIKRSSTTLQARLADDSAFASVQGKLTADTNAVAETPTATHTITIYDAAGTAYKVLCVAA